MSPPEFENLLSHSDWVRGLARRLVGESAAEDVVQETWLAALRRPPEQRADVRPWLARVVRNAATSMKRAQGARSRRERENARAEELPSSYDLAAEVELHRRLAGEVIALDEPYRRMVILRFYRGLTPREIAANEGLSVHTVKTRLQRATERLRTRLDQEFGGRQTWVPALFALAYPQPPPVPVGVTFATSLSWILVMKLTLTLLTAVTVVTAVYLLLGPTESDRPEPEDVVSQAASDAPLERVADLTTLSATTERKEVPSSVATSAEPVEPEAPVRSDEIVSGVLVGLDGEPLSGRRLRWFGPHAVRWMGNDSRELAQGKRRISIPPGREDEITAAFFADREHSEEWWWTFSGEAPAELLCTTDDRGRFDYPVPAEQTGGSLELEEPGWKYLGSGWRTGADGRELVLVAAPTIDLAGIVVDPQGAPLSGVMVIVQASFQSVADFPHILDTRPAPGETQVTAPDEQRWALTDREGRFLYAGVPLVPSGKLLLLEKGYENLEVPLPSMSDDTLRFVLTPAEEEDWGRVAGRVVDAHRQPVEGAEVAFSSYNAITAADGSFSFELREWIDSKAALLAMKEGHQAVVETSFGRRLAASREGHEDLLLVLGPEPLTLRGRVVDAAGEPQAGWSVALQDPTQKWVLCVEETLAGARHPIQTDAQGRFELGGLLDREYRLRAWHPQTHQLLVSDSFPAGTDGVEIVVPEDAFVDEFQGLVRGIDGVPIPDVAVGLYYRGVMMNREGSSIRSRTVRTDETGRFSLGRVPRSGIQVEVDSEVVARRTWPIEELTTGEEVVLQVHRLGRFRVELPDDDPANGFAVLDADGKRMPVDVFVPEFDIPGTYPSFVPRDATGTFPVSEVPDSAVALVVLQGQVELRRVDLHLMPGEMQVLRP